MSNPEITLCGRLSVTWDGESLGEKLPGRQGRILFAYLVLNRSHPVRRDELVEALWADEGLPSGGEALLAPPLSRLRKALGAGRLEGRSELSLQLGPDAVIDWEIAQSSLEAAQGLLAAGDSAGAYEKAIEAEAILSGGLLPGLEARWIEEQRAILEELRLTALETVARSGAGLGAGERARAERAARSAVDASPFRESARVAQIEVMKAQGNIAEALRSYEELRVLLREELGTYPSRELTALHEQLLNAHEDSREAKPASPGTSPVKRSTVPVGEMIDPRISAHSLVGRKEILEVLGQELELATSGELRIALLGGEGGAGKTRLAAELASSRDDITVLYGRCEPDEVRPFRIWSGLLRTALDQAGELDVEKIVGADGPTLARILPELIGRMKLPAPGPPADLESERQALFGAVLRVIGRLTTVQPLLIILDDLHWADRSTLMLLTSLAGDNPPKGVLALGIYRDTETPPDSYLFEAMVYLQRHLPTVRLKVELLETSEVRELISDRIDGSLAPALHDQTGGNPFLIEQMVRNIQETGDADPESAPVEVREVISRRVARLPDGAPELLSRAALIGREFDLPLLMATTGEDEDRVIEILDAAVAAGLLDESTEMPGRYAFIHALLRSTLSSGLSLTRLAQVHRNIGEAIERQARPGARLGEMAWHFGHAGPAESDRAILYATRAAAQAEARLAYDEAVGFYEDAIRACRSDEPVDQSELAKLLLSRAEAEWRIGELQKAGDTFFEAARAARESGVPSLLARAAIGTCWGSWESFDADRVVQAVLLEEALAVIGEQDGPLRAKLMAYLAHILYFGGGCSERAIGLVEEAHSMALRLGDPETEFTVLTATQFFMVERQNADRRMTSGNRCVEIAEESDDPEDLAEALAWRSVTWLSKGMCAEADADQARHALLNKTLPQITVAAAAMRAVRCFIEGNWDEGERLTDEFLARDIPQSARIAMEDAVHYQVRAQQGRLNEYLDHLERKAAVAEAWDTWPVWRIGLLLGKWQDGRFDEVRRELGEINYIELDEVPQMDILYHPFCGAASMLAFEMEDATGAAKLTGMMEPYSGEWSICGPAGSTFGPIDLLLGEMFMLQGKYREAATYFERAVDNCEEMRAMPYLARAQLGLSAALHELGDPDGPERGADLRAAGWEKATKLELKPTLQRYSDG